MPKRLMRLGLALGLAAGGAAVVYDFGASPYVASYALITLAALIAVAGTGWPSGRSKRLFLLTAVSMLCLAALDAEVGLIFFPRITMEGRSDRFIIPDPLLGYAPRPGVRARIIWRRFGRTIYDAHYGIDPRGHRLTVGSNDHSATSVVFVGDSYTFGDGLNDTQALPARFSQTTGFALKVTNAAFSGYGTNQVLRLVDSGRLIPDLKSGPRLIIYSASDQQLGRIDDRAWVHRAGTPRFVLEEGRLRDAGVFEPGWLGTSVALASRSAIVAGLRDLALAAPSPASARLFGAMVAAARDAAKLRYGADFLVLLWDEPAWQDGGDVGRARQRTAAVQAMAAEMQARGVPYLRVSALIPDYTSQMSSYVLSGSGHPSAALNQRLARALAGKLALSSRQ